MSRSPQKGGFQFSTGGNPRPFVTARADEAIFSAETVTEVSEGFVFAIGDRRDICSTARDT